MTLRCEIATQDKLLFQGDVDIVVAPTTLGELGILPNHTPLLTKLDYGVLKIRHGGIEELFTVSGGVLEARPDMVIVLADVGEHIDEIDYERAEAARRRAEDLLKQIPSRNTEEYLAVEAALRRSMLRLEAVQRFRRTSRRRSRRDSVEDT
ncbi:MAG: ATP synthase F1 subunit epsilon [Anaerolineales bacterium]|nr:ATP synthase F1 subunit epsilon [Anaerolineales bacterium]